MDDSIESIRVAFQNLYRGTHTKQQSAQQIAKWFRYWYVVRKSLSDRLQPLVKNDACFYSMEPYDRKRTPRPYFYHIVEQDTKDKKTNIHVYEFEPTVLCRFLEESKRPINPFTKQTFNKPELMRLDRIRHYKQPLAPHLDINGLTQHQDGDAMQVESALNSLQQMFASVAESRDYRHVQDHQIRELFRSSPQVMLDFIRSEVEHRDQNLPRRRRFVRELVELASKHFENS